MVLYDSHAECDLITEGKRIVVAGMLSNPANPVTLHAYSNMSCLMQMPDATDQSDEDTGTGAKREG